MSLSIMRCDAVDTVVIPNHWDFWSRNLMTFNAQPSKHEYHNLSASRFSGLFWIQNFSKDFVNGISTAKWLRHYDGYPTTDHYVLGGLTIWIDSHDEMNTMPLITFIYYQSADSLGLIVLFRHNLWSIHMAG